jgi:septal ring-binding cell division protein DamX
VALATAAAWYFFLRVPGGVTQRPPVTPTPIVSSTLAARPSSLDAPATVPSIPLPAAATPAPSVEPTAAATPRVTPTPLPRASPRPPAATSDAGDGRALLRRGALPEAARAFAGSLAASRSAYSLQILTACAPETVQKAVNAAGGDELFILPVVLNGRACFRVCWGVYDSRKGAETALTTIPAYFRQGGARPRLSTLAELLP